MLDRASNHDDKELFQTYVLIFQWYCDQENIHSVAFDVLSLTECFFLLFKAMK